MDTMTAVTQAGDESDEQESTSLNPMIRFCAGIQSINIEQCWTRWTMGTA